MDNSQHRLHFIALISCFTVCIGDFLVTFALSAMYPKYDSIDQSMSYLGVSGSPVAGYMTVWGVVFFILFLIFALGVGNTSAAHEKWSWLAAGLIIVYGAGEGLGSGLFPYNHLHGSLTIMGKLHAASSAAGVFALAALPLIADKMFKQKYKFKRYARYVFFSGLFLVSLFLASRLNSIPYRGLWQRLFILNYYVFLMIWAVVLRKRIAAPT